MEYNNQQMVAFEVLIDTTKTQGQRFAQIIEA